MQTHSKKIHRSWFDSLICSDFDDQSSGVWTTINWWHSAIRKICHHCCKYHFWDYDSLFLLSTVSSAEECRSSSRFQFGSFETGCTKTICIESDTRSSDVWKTVKRGGKSAHFNVWVKVCEIKKPLDPQKNLRRLFLTSDQTHVHKHQTDLLHCWSRHLDLVIDDDLCWFLRHLENRSRLGPQRFNIDQISHLRWSVFDGRSRKIPKDDDRRLLF